MAASARTGGARALLAAEVLVGLGVVAAIVGGTYGAFPTLTFVLCGGAVAYTGWVGSRMLSALRDPTLEVEGKHRDIEREKLEGEKRLLLQGIKDLEADRQTGKMSEDEYQRLRASAEARAVEILRVLRESDERWATEAENLLASRRRGSAPSAGGREPASPNADPRVFPTESSTASQVGQKLACDACSFENDDDARFCAGCGRALGREEAA
jgi:hypothetical protein